MYSPGQEESVGKDLVSKRGSSIRARAYVYSQWQYLVVGGYGYIYSIWAVHVVFPPVVLLRLRPKPNW